MKKIIDFLRYNTHSSPIADNLSKVKSKGFTLIELLIVIAVLGILAAAILIAIDPIDRINAGNDAKVQTDIRQIYDASILFYTTQNEFPDLGIPGLSDELKSIPEEPNNYTAYLMAYEGGSYQDAEDVEICGEVKSKANKNKAINNNSSVYIRISQGDVCYNENSCDTTYVGCTNITDND